MDDLPTACYACGRGGVLGDGPRCGCGEPRWLATDAEGFEWPDGDGRPAGPGGRTGLWRYADLLPVAGERAATGTPAADDGSAADASVADASATDGSSTDGSSTDGSSADGRADDASAADGSAADGSGVPTTGVASAVGGTPLYRTPGLDDYAGCRLHLKDETANPTGSFKDRGSAVGVAAAAAAGRGLVGTVSHGNMARSVAATAAGAGLDAVVLVPGDVPEERLAPIARYGPTILRVEGDYGRLYRESLAAGRDRGVPFVNSDVPLRVAGQKTVAFEVAEAFAGPGEGDANSLPDAVVLPVSSGGHASAVWKGLRELRAAGPVGTLPRLYLTQAAACDPVARAYRNGDERVAALPDDGVGETAAYSIANADPPSGTRALAAARATGGAVVSVPEGELLAARDALAERAGVAVEPASATALAGLRRLSAEGAVDEAEDVVLVATGAAHGATDLAVSVDSATVAEVPRRVADLLDGRAERNL